VSPIRLNVDCHARAADGKVDVQMERLPASLRNAEPPRYPSNPRCLSARTRFPAQLLPAASLSEEPTPECSGA
jgi:hypothetical protein